MMKRLFALVGSLLLIVVFTTSALAQGGLNPGSGSVNFTVMNLDANEASQVVAEYVNQNGQVDATKNVQIQPRSSEGFPIDAAGLPDNWAGSVIISADKEIVAFGQARWEGGTYGDGKTAGAYNGFTEGANTLYFPSLAARSGKQFSFLTVQSAEGASTSESITITINFYDRAGNLSKTIHDTFLKGTQVTYNLLEIGLPTTNPPGDGWLGSAVVESTSPIAGVATMHWKYYSAAYSAVTGGGTTIYLPSATRRLPKGPWYQYTSILVQNLDASNIATVTTHWYDREGTELFSFQDTIPANSSHGYNTRWTSSDVPDHDALYNALGNNWNGSVVITSTTNIVAVANLQWTEDSPVGNSATAYTSDYQGYEEVFIPATFRRVDGDTWKQFTGLVIQNIGSSACNNFQVQWRDRSGNTLLSYTDSLEPNISHGYNSRYGADGSDFPSGVNVTNLGNDFRGSVYINAPGCKLIAIHNTLWPLWTDSTTYNAFGK